MRLIDADALEKAIYEWMPKDQSTWMDSDLPPIENLVVSIMMTIQEQPTINTKYGEWILLSEKIPEMDERVVVTTHGYDYHIWDCMSNRRDDYFWEDEEGLYHNKYEVVAWLPLPEVML